MPGPHDQLFRGNFSDPERLGELLRAVLPPDVVALVDWDSLSVEKDSFVDEALRESVSDVLAHATIAGSRNDIAVLLEHKTGSIAGIAGQILAYVQAEWGRQRAAAGNPQRFTPNPVLVVIVFRGRARQRLIAARDLVARTTGHSLGLDRWSPRVPVLALNLAAIDPLDDERVAVGPDGRLTLLCLGAKGAPSVIARLRGRVDLVRQALISRRGRSALARLLQYVAELRSFSTHEIDQLARELAGDALTEVAMSVTQLWKEEGRQEGSVLGRRAMLTRQLVRRFGPLPDAARERLEAAAAEQLDEWADRVLDAKSLQAVFDGG